MPRPRRKPFLRWAPLPWLVLVLLMLVTGSLHDIGADALYVVGIVVTVLFVVALIIGITVAARRRGPNFTAEGHLARLEGLELIEAPAAGHPITVADVRRHQISIGAALARSTREPRAILVPDVGNWWNRRSDIGVYLLSDHDFHHVGRIGDQAQVAWQRELDELRAQGRFAVVPAVVTGVAPKFAVDVRLEGLRAVEAAGAGATEPGVTA
ncbi:hypothetical protein GCM10022286_26160 [Gryllotalpicola daejeonensis]|uniref:DUF58 domain-containing protein n=1 Tax=Gryllotalpicola daejeonensis TaxID=993087 RepID=A0ABP7ZMY9_9MICO